MTPSPDTLVVALRRLVRESPLRLRVSGGCMHPVLAAGSHVALAPVRVPLPGDIVAFGAPGRLQVHRVLGYRPRLLGLDLVTRGDLAAAVDPPIPLSRVIGRVPAPVPWRDRLRALAAFARHVGARARARFG